MSLSLGTMARHVVSSRNKSNKLTNSRARQLAVIYARIAPRRCGVKAAAHLRVAVAASSRED